MGSTAGDSSLDDDINKSLNGSASLDTKIKTLESLLASDPNAIKDKVKLAYTLVGLSCDTIRFGTPAACSPLIVSLIRVLNQFSADPTCLNVFRKDNRLLEKVSFWPIVPQASESVIETYFILAERLTRDVNLLYKYPGLEWLISSCLEAIKRRKSNMSFLQALRVLNNLVQNSPAASVTARNCPLFKEVWTSLVNFVLDGKDEDIRMIILACTLVVILDYHYMGRGFSSGFRLAYNAIGSIMVDDALKRENNGDEYIESLRELTALLATLRDQVIGRMSESRVVENGVFSQMNVSRPGAEGDDVVQFVELSKYVLGQLQAAASQIWHLEQIPAFLDMLVAVTPDFVINCDDGNELLCLMNKIITGLTTAAAEDQIPIPSWQVIECYQHLVTHVMRLGGDVLEDFQPCFGDVLRHCYFLDSSQLHWERQAIACTRVMTHVQRVPAIKNLAEEQIKAALPKQEAIIRLACGKENPLDKDIGKMQLTAIIEVFGFLAQNSQIKRAMEILKETANTTMIGRYIALALVSGDRELICPAFTIISSVCFTREIQNSAVLALSELNCSKMLPTSKIFTKSPLSPEAAMGLSRLEAMLQAIKASPNEPTAEADVAEVISFYETKCAYYEHENQMLREQLNECNRNTDQFNVLMRKERQVMAFKVSKVEFLESKIIGLSTELDTMAKEEQKVTSNLFKEISGLEKVVAQKATKLEDCYQRISRFEKQYNDLQKTLEGQNAKLNKELEALRTNNKALNDQLRAKDIDLEEKKAKIKKLQREIKSNEDEKKRLEALLEREKKIADTIRGVLGSGAGS